VAQKAFIISGINKSKGKVAFDLKPVKISATGKYAPTEKCL